MSGGTTMTQTFRDRILVGEVHAHTLDSRLLRDENGDELGVTVHVPMTRRFAVETDGSSLLSLGRMVDVPGEAMPVDVFEIGSDVMPMNLRVHGADQHGNPTVFSIERDGTVNVKGVLNVDGRIDQSAGDSSFEAHNDKKWEFDGASGDVSNEGNLAVGIAGPGEDIKRALTVHNTVNVGVANTINDRGLLRVFGNGRDFVVDGMAQGGLAMTLTGSLDVQGGAVSVSHDGDVGIRPGSGAGDLTVQANNVGLEATGETSFLGTGPLRVGRNMIGQGKNVTFFSRAEVVGPGVTFEERHFSFNGATGRVNVGGDLVVAQGLDLRGGEFKAENVTNFLVQSASVTLDAPDVSVTGNLVSGLPSSGRTITFHGEGGRDTTRSHLGDWNVAGNVLMAPSTTFTTKGNFFVGGVEERGGNFSVMAQEVLLSSSAGAKTMFRGGEVEFGLETAPVRVTLHGPSAAEDVVFEPDVSGNSLLHVGGNLRVDKNARFGGDQVAFEAREITLGSVAAGTTGVTLTGDLVTSAGPFKVGLDGAGRNVTFVAGTPEHPRGFTFAAEDGSGHAHFRGPLTVGGLVALESGVQQSAPTEPVSFEGSIVSLTSAGAVYVSAAEPVAVQGGAQFVSGGGVHANVTVDAETGKVTVGTGGLEVGGPVQLDATSGFEKLGTSHPVTLEGSHFNVTTQAGASRIRFRGGRVEVGQSGHGGSTGLTVFGWSTSQRNLTVDGQGRLEVNNSAAFNHAVAMNAETHPATFSCQNFAVTTSSGAVSLETQELVVGNGVGTSMVVHGVQSGEAMTFDRDAANLAVTGSVSAGRGVTCSGPLTVSAVGPGQNAAVTANNISLTSTGGNIDVRGGNVRLFADSGTPDAGGRVLTLRAASGANSATWNGSNGNLSVGGAVSAAAGLSTTGSISFTGGTSDASLAGRSFTANYSNGMRFQGSRFTVGPDGSAGGRNTHVFEVRGNTITSNASLIFTPGIEGVANDSSLAMNGRMTVRGASMFEAPLTVHAGEGKVDLTAATIELNAGNPAAGGRLRVQRTNVDFGTSSAGMGVINFHAPDLNGTVFDGASGEWTVRGRFNTAAQTSLFDDRLRMWVDGNSLTRATFGNIDAFDVTVNPGRVITLSGSVVVGDVNGTTTLVASSGRDMVFEGATGLLRLGGDVQAERSFSIQGENAQFTYNNQNANGLFTVVAHEAVVNFGSRLSLFSSTGASPELHIGSAEHGGVATTLFATSGPNFTFNADTGAVTMASLATSHGLSNSGGPVSLHASSGSMALSSHGALSVVGGGPISLRGTAIALGGDGQGNGERTAWTMRLNGATEARDLTWNSTTGAMTVRGPMTTTAGATIQGGLVVNDASGAVTITTGSMGITSTAPLQVSANLQVGANGDGRTVEFRSTASRTLVFDGSSGVLRSAGAVLVNHLPGDTPSATLFSVRGTVGNFAVANSGHVTAQNVACAGLTTIGGVNVGGSATVGSTMTIEGMGPSASGHSFNLLSGNARIGGDLYVAGTLTAEHTTNTTVDNIVFENHMIVMNSQENESEQTIVSANGGGMRVLAGPTEGNDYVHKDLRFARGGEGNVSPDDRPYPDYDSDLNAASWQSNQHLVLGSRRGLVFSPGGNQVTTRDAHTLGYVSVTQEVSAGGVDFNRFQLASFNAMDEVNPGTRQDVKSFMPGTRIAIPDVGARKVASINMGDRVFSGVANFAASGLSTGNRLVVQFTDAHIIPTGTFITLLSHDPAGSLALSSVYRVVNSDVTGLRLDRIYQSEAFSRHVTIFAMPNVDERPHLRVRRSAGDVPPSNGALTPVASGVTIDPQAMGAWRFVVDYNDAGESMMSLQVRAKIPNTSGAAEYERYWKTVTSWSET